MPRPATAYPRLIRRVERPARCGPGQARRRPSGASRCVQRSAADSTVDSTPCGREAGEIPAQSRYGERSLESASPVADHTVHARTFERKVGRTRATDRLRPLLRRVSKRGVSRFVATPPSPSRLRRFPVFPSFSSPARAAPPGRLQPVARGPGPRSSPRAPAPPAPSPSPERGPAPARPPRRLPRRPDPQPVTPAPAFP